MKNKLLTVSCAAALVASLVSLTASLTTRARAIEAAPAPFGLTVVAQDAETRVYTFEHDGHRCFLASTRAGSGVSLQCLK